MRRLLHHQKLPKRLRRLLRELRTAPTDRQWLLMAQVVRKCLRKLPLVLGRQFSCPPGAKCVESTDWSPLWRLESLNGYLCGLISACWFLLTLPWLPAVHRRP